MKRFATKLGILLILCCLVLLLFIKNVEAAEQNTPSIPFSVTPILPENQHKDVKGSWFRLQVEAKQTQRIYVSVRNTTNKTITVKASTANASTAPNLGIQYLAPKKDDNLLFLDKTYQLADNLTIQETITLKPNEQKKVPIDVRVPNIKKGTAIGGLLFEDTDEENIDQIDSKKKGASFYIRNKFVRAIAVQLDVGEPVKDDFSFGEAGVRFIPSGIQLWFEVKNNAAAIFDGEDGKFDVYDSRNQLVFSGKINQIRMAPKTKIQYPVFWNNKEVKTGKYTIKLTAKINGKSVHHETEFTVKRKEIKEYYKDSGIQTPVAVFFPTWAIVLMTLGGVMVIGLIGWGIRILLKRKKNNSTDK